MIIFFCDPNDPSTKEIQEWLCLKAKNSFITINTSQTSEDYIGIKEINSTNIVFEINGKLINSKDIKAVFFRRNSIKTRETFPRHEWHSEDMSDYVLSNNYTLHEILTDFFSKLPSFGDEGVGRINKILTLNKAKKVGFKIPDYLVTSDKSKLELFIKKHDEVVVKSIDIGPNIVDYKNKRRLISYTTLITKKKLDDIPKSFPLSFFQNKINKCFEVRCFYHFGKFFAVAIFSQSNKKTSLDYRRYDYTLPNREVPFILPGGLKKKIKALFEKINLNTGSLDIIIRNTEYYFLEINPVGQFGNVSFMGNWYIEKKIADYLVSNGKKQKNKK